MSLFSMVLFSIIYSLANLKFCIIIMVEGSINYINYMKILLLLLLLLLLIIIMIIIKIIIIMKKVNKQCLLDTPRTVRVSEKDEYNTKLFTPESFIYQTLSRKNSLSSHR